MVVANGVPPVALVLLSRVHVVQESGLVVHRPPVLQLPGLVVQLGHGLVELS
jgi:hypothetical protein